LVRVVVLGAGISGHTAAAFARRWLGEEHYVRLDGSEQSERFDFAMLIPPFAGVGLRAFTKDGTDINLKMIRIISRGH